MQNAYTKYMNSQAAAAAAALVVMPVATTKVVPAEATPTPTAKPAAQKRQIRFMKELHTDRIDVEQPEQIIRSSLGTWHVVRSGGWREIFDLQVRVRVDKHGMEKVVNLFKAVEHYALPVPVLKAKTVYKKRRAAEQSSSSSSSSSESEVESKSGDSIDRVLLSDSSDDANVNDDIPTKTLVKAIKATQTALRDLRGSSESDSESDDDSSEEKLAAVLLKSVANGRGGGGGGGAARGDSGKRLRKSVDRFGADADKSKANLISRAVPRVVPMPPPPPPPLLMLASAAAAVVVDNDVVEYDDEPTPAVAPKEHCRMVAFNLSMLRMFAGNNPTKTAFIDRVMACAGDRVDVTGIDVTRFIETDAEEAVFYALVSAVVPMRFGGSSGSTMREYLSIEQANAMRAICARLQLPFALYVTPHYRLPMREFEEYVYRAYGMGWDGALSFNPETGRARFWVSRCETFKIGVRSWASLSLPRGSPDSAYADGATEYEFTYDAATQRATLLGTPTIDDVVLERRGDDLRMTCGDFNVPFVNMAVRNALYAAPAVPIVVATATAAAATGTL